MNWLIVAFVVLFVLNGVILVLAIFCAIATHRLLGHVVADDERTSFCYRFMECPWLSSPNQMLIANTQNLEWPGPPPLLEPEDDLLVLFHPDLPEADLGRMVNTLRDRGHEVVVDRSAGTADARAAEARLLGEKELPGVAHSAARKEASPPASADGGCQHDR